jgi:hypothetical protein
MDECTFWGIIGSQALVMLDSFQSLLLPTICHFMAR